MKKGSNKINNHTHSKVQEYIILVQSYLNLEMPSKDFKKAFFVKFLNEPEGMKPELFNILNDLFLDADAYSPLWQEADESLTRITEKTFRNEAAVALKLLIEFITLSE